uniref:Ras-related protein Rab-39A n=1 Tax=Falco tinnunculus TaxID=100819 RepID=A0A8C4XTK2_FALTI
RLGAHCQGCLPPTGLAVGDRAAQETWLHGIGELQDRGCMGWGAPGTWLSVTRSYYRNSAGGMLLFDLTNRASFESVRQWHREVVDTVQPFRIVFLLVGHKSDLAGQRRVGRREAEKLAASLGVQYIETSAKDASNVAQAFQMLTLAIYQALQTGRLAPTEAWDGVKSSVPLPAPPKAQALEKDEKQKRCSC